MYCPRSSFFSSTDRVLVRETKDGRAGRRGEAVEKESSSAFVGLLGVKCKGRVGDGFGESWGPVDEAAERAGEVATMGRSGLGWSPEEEVEEGLRWRSSEDEGDREG